MRKKLLYFAVFTAISFFAHTQTVRVPVSSAFTKLNAYSTTYVNAFSFGPNQAALASLQNFSAAIFSERRFLLKELSFYSLALGLPTSHGNFGFKADYFGDATNNESGLGISYGRKLGERIDLGVQFNYYNHKIAGYGSASAINAEGGLILHLTEGLNFGIHIYNPTGVKIGKIAEERLPAAYSAGFGYELSKKFYIGFEVEKIEDQPVNINVGLQYYFQEKMIASAGITSASSSYFLGFGVWLKSFQLNAVATVHPQLGITPGLLLLFKKEKSE